MTTTTLPNHRSGFTATFEWQTGLLITGVYASWFLLAQNYHLIGPLFAIPLLGIVVTLFGSTAHEIIHGHPTRNARLNSLLVGIPLTLFLPFPIYRDTHLRHHRDENITIPGKDPESFYCSARDYQRKSKLGRALAWLNMTMIGRLLFSPAIEIYHLGLHALTAVLNGDRVNIRLWIIHLLSTGALLWLISAYFEIPLWQYFLIAYLGGSLGRIRSFYEHRARPAVSERTVLMEPCFFFRMLFLNLNYHLAHHERPSIPWYRLGQFYQAHRTELIVRSGDFYYPGYTSWLLGFLIRPVDSPIHPFDCDPGRGSERDLNRI